MLLLAFAYFTMFIISLIMFAVWMVITVNWLGGVKPNKIVNAIMLTFVVVGLAVFWFISVPFYIHKVYKTGHPFLA